MSARTVCWASGMPTSTPWATCAARTTAATRRAAAIAHLTGQLQLAMDSTGDPGGGASGERQQPAERRGVPALADELQHPAPARAAADALLRRLTEDEPLKRAKHPCRRHCAHCTAGGLPCAFSVRSDKHRPYAALVAHKAAPAERKGGGRGGGISNCHGWATQGDREYAAAANQLMCLLDHLQYTRAFLAGRTAIVDIAVCSIDAQCQTYAILLGAVRARLAEGKAPRQIKQAEVWALQHNITYFLFFLPVFMHSLGLLYIASCHFRTSLCVCLTHCLAITFFPVHLTTEFHQVLSLCILTYRRSQLRCFQPPPTPISSSPTPLSPQ